MKGFLSSKFLFQKLNLIQCDSYRHHRQTRLVELQLRVDLGSVDGLGDADAAPVVQHPAQQLGRVGGVGDAGVLAAVEIKAGFLQGSVQTFGPPPVKFLVRKFLEKQQVCRVLEKAVMNVKKQTQEQKQRS